MQKTELSRRHMLTASGGMLALAAANPAWALGMPQEGPDTPKLTMYMQDCLDKAEQRRLKQIGIDWVDTQAVPEQPWSLHYLQTQVDSLRAAGLSLGIMMIRWSFRGGMDPDMSQIVYAGPNRDREIAKIKDTIVNAGKVGLPVVEYNFYNHRAVEGYAQPTGRGGAGLTEFQYDRMKDLPPLPAEGAHTYEETWKNLTYFLKDWCRWRRKIMWCCHCTPTIRRRRSAAVRPR